MMEGDKSEKGDGRKRELWGHGGYIGEYMVVQDGSVDI